MPRTSLSKFVEEEKTKEDEVIIEETPVQEKKLKKYRDDDLIPCVSITAGNLYLIGAKSNEKYTWDGIGAVCEVEYGDLMREIRNHTSYIFKPLFIIQDKDFLSQHPEVDDAYGAMYTPEDIRKVLAMDHRKMKSVIEQMPVGAQEALKDLAITMIERGELDSIQRIKVIDEYFGTEMLMKMAH